MPIRKLLFNMSLPLMLSLVIQSLYNIVDSMYVSRLSEDALAATSLAYPVQFLMIAISVGTAVGLNALMSRYLGSKEHEKACRIATTGLILCVLSALVFAVIGLFGSSALAASFTDDPEIAAMTNAYMRICVVFCGGIFLETLGQRMLTAAGFSSLSMVSLICGAVLNIILDPILIFGYLGFPEMGISGAAIATVIGQWTGACIALLLNRFKNPDLHFQIKNYKFMGKDVLEIYRIGLPTMIMQAVGSIMVAAVNAILIQTSSTAVAFFGVYYKLQNFVMMPMNGLGQAALPITAYNYGSGDKGRIHRLYKVLIPSAVVFSCVGVLIFMVWPAQLLALFDAQAEMLSIGTPALRVIAITFPLAAVTIVNGYFCTGLGNSVINMISGAIRQLVVLVPCLWLLDRVFGIGGAWYAFWPAELLAFLYSEWMAKREKVKKASLKEEKAARSSAG